MEDGYRSDDSLASRQGWWSGCCSALRRTKRPAGPKQAEKPVPADSPAPGSPYRSPDGPMTDAPTPAPAPAPDSTSSHSPLNDSLLQTPPAEAAEKKESQPAPAQPAQPVKRAGLHPLAQSPLTLSTPQTPSPALGSANMPNVSALATADPVFPAAPPVPDDAVSVSSVKTTDSRASRRSFRQRVRSARSRSTRNRLQKQPRQSAPPTLTSPILPGDQPPMPQEAGAAATVSARISALYPDMGLSTGRSRSYSTTSHRPAIYDRPAPPVPISNSELSPDRPGATSPTASFLSYRSELSPGSRKRRFRGLFPRSPPSSGRPRTAGDHSALSPTSPSLLSPVPHIGLEVLEEALQESLPDFDYWGRRPESIGPRRLSQHDLAGSKRRSRSSIVSQAQSRLYRRSMSQGSLGLALTTNMAEEAGPDSSAHYYADGYYPPVPPMPKSPDGFGRGRVVTSPTPAPSQPFPSVEAGQSAQPTHSHSGSISSFVAKPLSAVASRIRTASVRRRRDPHLPSDGPFPADSSPENDLLSPTRPRRMTTDSVKAAVLEVEAAAAQKSADSPATHRPDVQWQTLSDIGSAMTRFGVPQENRAAPIGTAQADAPGPAKDTVDMPAYSFLAHDEQQQHVAAPDGRQSYANTTYMGGTTFIDGNTYVGASSSFAMPAPNAHEIGRAVSIRMQENQSPSVDSINMFGGPAGPENGQERRPKPADADPTLRTAAESNDIFSAT